MVESQPNDPQFWLAETKFQPPLLREDVILRQPLLADLHTFILSHSLTLLSAPAGYGKSTLLGSIPAAYPDFPLAWLSLDEEDNDPIRFMTALIVALQHLNPACGAVSQSLLISQTYLGSELRRLTGVLINDVLECLTHPFALVLDDLHHITEPVIFAALDYLLENLPSQMHLVVATRIDPPVSLARLKARGELAELRMANLRFSDDEAMTFFNDSLQLGLSTNEVALLQSHNEGWPVGLRLFASSLNHSASYAYRLKLIYHLTNTDGDIFDFLAEEVFNCLEREVKTFLMETAILKELSPTLCKAVTQRADAGAMLEDLYHHNLFLVRISPLQRRTDSEIREADSSQPQPETNNPLPERRYRYHDLFAEFLSQMLYLKHPERVPELHRRAARAQIDRSRAVVHYLAASEWQQAATIIEQIGAELFARGYIDTLSRWINRLPAPVREDHPRLLQLLSNCAFWKGSWGEAKSLVERALQAFEAAGDKVGQGEMLINLANCTAGGGDLEACAALYSQALEFPISPQSQLQALLGRALASGTWGDWVQFEGDFNTAMALFQPGGGLESLQLETLPLFHPSFAIVPGGIEHLERIADLARAQVDGEISLSRLMVEELRTALYLIRGQLTDAIRTGEGALSLRKRLGGHPYMSLNAGLFLMLAYAARGDFASIDPLFDGLFREADQTDQPTPDLTIYLFYAGRVRWLQGRLKEAGEIYDQMRELIKPGSQRDFLEARICCAWMSCLLEISEGHYRKAESILRQPEVLEQKDRNSIMEGNTRLMLARLYWRQNRQQEALSELNGALAYHEQLGIPFAFILEGQSIVPLLRKASEQSIHKGYADFVLGLLGANDEPHPVEVPYTGATLTPREVEVLRLVIAGDSNRMIAERLVISEWTVKSHLTSAYRKLDVTSRTQAISRARELGLADPSHVLN